MGISGHCSRSGFVRSETDDGLVRGLHSCVGLRFSNHICIDMHTELSKLIMKDTGEVVFIGERVKATFRQH